MLKVYLTQNNNSQSAAYGKYYAMADNNDPWDIDQLAQWMADQNNGHSYGEIVGVLGNMVRAIRQLVLMGQPVKLKDLAIFSAHVENQGGWPTLADVSLSMGGTGDNLQGIRLSAQATGMFTKAELTRSGSIALNREWKQRVQDAKKGTDTSGTVSSGTTTSGSSTPSGMTDDDDVPSITPDDSLPSGSGGSGGSMFGDE